MQYQPSSFCQDAVLTSAELNQESYQAFMSLIREKKRVSQDLQERRENAVLNNKYAMDVSPDPDSFLEKKQLDNIDLMNASRWRTIVENCYIKGRSLDRSLSVSKDYLPIASPRSITVDIEKARVETINGRDVVEIYYNDDISLILDIDTDNIESYQTHQTKNLETLNGQLENFEELRIRDTPAANKNVKVILSNDTKRVYIPKRQLIEDNQQIKDIVEQLSLLPNETSKLLKTLEKEHISSEKALKLLDAIDNRKTVDVEYEWLASPSYIEQVAKITDMSTVGVPQQGIIVFFDEDVPEWMTKLDDKFPDKNALSDKETEELYSYLDTPSFITPNWEETDGVKCKEILLELFQDGTITQDKIVSFYLVPWKQISPTKESVLDAIEYGENIRRKVKQIDNKYGTDLYESIVVSEQRKIYGDFQSNEKRKL